MLCNDRNAIITEKWIDDEIGIVRYRMLTRKNVKEDWTKRGAELPRKKISDLIEEVISSKSQEDVDYNTGIWLKFEGTGDDRVNNELNYFQMKGSRNRDIKLTYFPKNKRPTGIKSGDTLFIGVVSYDKDGNPTPMIVGYAISEGFHKDNVVSQGEIIRHPWKERFPYFIEFAQGHFINTPIKNGIRLVDMYSVIGNRTFPSTMKETNVTAESLRQMHFRRSHLHITSEAKDYLMNQLEKLFKQYGKLTI